ncbi:hypothetical protein ABPG75_004736 [Micractinium tetrahymenae]
MGLARPQGPAGGGGPARRPAARRRAYASIAALLAATMACAAFGRLGRGPVQVVSLKAGVAVAGLGDRSAQLAAPAAEEVPSGASVHRPQHKFLIFFSGHQGSSALTDMLASHPSVFVPGFEPLDMDGLTAQQKLRFLEATFSFPAPGAAADWARWRSHLLPPVPGLRVDRGQLSAPGQIMGESVAGFKLRPYPLVGIAGGGPPSGSSGAGGGSSGSTGGGGGGHTALAGLNPAAVRALLQRHNVSVLLTLRRNTLKEALSWYKARELGVSQFTARQAGRTSTDNSSAAGSNVGRVDHAASPGAPSSAATSAGGFGAGSGMPSSDGHAGSGTSAAGSGKLTADIPRVLRWLNYTERVNAQLRQAAAYFDRPTLTIWYEDFQADPLGVAQRAADFIGVPNGSSGGSAHGLQLSSKFRKAGPDAIEGWLENYEELCRVLEGTRHYRFLNQAACPPPLNASRASPVHGAPRAAQQPGQQQLQLPVGSTMPLLDSWCTATDKLASGWGALSDAECMRSFAAVQQKAVEAVRRGSGMMLFKHIHKAGGSTMCELAQRNMAAESPLLPGRSDWTTNCVPYEAFLGPHPAVGSGGARPVYQSSPAAGTATAAGAGSAAGLVSGTGVLSAAVTGPEASSMVQHGSAAAGRRRLQAHWLGGACWLGFLTPPQLRALPRHFAPLRFVASEGPLQDAVALDAPVAWVTMLRRPLDRVLSSYRWWQLMTERWPQSPAECHAYSAPANATLERWLAAYPDNWMVRELVGRTALYQRGRPMTEADLLLAQQRLHLFAAVLLLERPDTSMALLRAMFGWRETGWGEHRAGSRVGSDAGAELPPGVLRELERRHALDVRLYAYAEALHAAQARRWLGGNGGGGASACHKLMSSVMEALGSAEKAPEGWRRLGFHCHQLWRRGVAEFWVEWPLFKRRAWVIIAGLVFQYIHAIFTGMAYYMHTPLPVDNTTLHDLGFEALPYLDVDAVSEVMVYCGFAAFFIWLFSPFLTRRKSFHSVVVLKRVLVILVSCQVLRILTFLSTQIPAPAPHCRAPEPTSNVPWPVWWQVIIVNVSRQASKGCGDLIFSSHITFLLTFTWTYAVLGHSLLLKALAYAYTCATALCIIASRKHYTVDVIVAAYVVPLVFFHYRRHWTTLRDDCATADNRGIISLLQALPVAATDASAAGGAPSSRGANGSAHSGGSSGKFGPAGSSRARESAMEAAAAAEAGKAVAGLAAEAPVTVDIELAEQQTSSAPVLEPGAAAGGSQPGSPVKSALSMLADLPRRMTQGGGGRPGSGSVHRRTESQEPVLANEDHSASSLG